MARYFCLIEKEDLNDPSTTGLDYVMKHQGDWVKSTDDIDSTLAPGWTKGTDFMVHDNKAYALYKTFMFPTEDNVVYLCKYSPMGCDIIK